MLNMSLNSQMVKTSPEFSVIYIINYKQIIKFIYHLAKTKIYLKPK